MSSWQRRSILRLERSPSGSVQRHARPAVASISTTGNDVSVPIVMGLNGARGFGHDAGAALVVDGRLQAAVEEERLARVKRAYGLPPVRAMREVLDLSGLRLADVDVVAYPWLPQAMGVDPDDIERQIRSWFAEANLSPRRDLLVRFIAHHVAHAWAGMAFVPGGLRDRRIGVVVLDGSGESTSGACYMYGPQLRQVWSLSQDSSPGIYFEAVSQYLGFSWGQEGKTMALASYARHPGAPVPSLPDHRTYDASPAGPYHGESPHQIHQTLRWRLIEDLAALNRDRLSFERRADVAQAGQQVIGRRIVRYASELLDDIDVLVLSGGVALNCAINSEVASICRRNEVEFVVPPPASDTGVAIGSALAPHRRRCLSRRRVIRSWDAALSPPRWALSCTTKARLLRSSARPSSPAISPSNP